MAGPDCAAIITNFNYISAAAAHHSPTPVGFFRVHIPLSTYTAGDESQAEIHNR